MRLLQHIKKRSILRIGLEVTISMMLLLLIFSNVIYRSFERQSLIMIDEYNQKSLSRIAHLIVYTDNIIKNYLYTQMSNADINLLMVSDDNNLSENLQKINIMSSIQRNLQSNPMVNSIVIYNGQIDEYFSTLGWSIKRDEMILGFFENDTDIEALTPIPRMLDPDVYYKTNTKVFTYFIKNITGPNERQSGLAVNIKTDWIFSNLNEIKEDSSNLILARKDGSVIEDSSHRYDIYNELEPAYFSGIQNSIDGSFTVDINGERRILTFHQIDGMDMLLIYDQPYDGLYVFVNELKRSVLILTLVFVLLSIIVSTLVSRLIYKPYKKLVTQVKFNQNPSLSIENDIEYLSNVFNNNLSKIKEIDEYKTNTRSILKENLLKTILLESNTTNNLLSENVFDEYKTGLSNMRKIILVLFKVDHFSRYIKNDFGTRNNVRLLLSDTSNEFFSEKCNCEVILMGNGECVVIADVAPVKSKERLDLIKDVIRNVQDRIKENSTITISAFISNKFSDISSINKYYKLLQNMASYRIIYGQNLILTQKAISSRDLNNSYPLNIEEKIISKINSLKLDDSIKYLDSFVEKVSKMDIDNFMLSITRLVLAVNRSVNDMNINRFNEVIININDFSLNLIGHESIDEIRSDFIQLFSNIINQSKIRTEDKHHVLASSIKEYIDEYLDDKDLCLKTISSKFKLSSVYLGMIFKENMNVSVHEYINRKRHDGAAEYLANTNLSINEIIERIGYENEANFYRLFKKFYGVTPNEYRIRHSMAQRGT